MIDAPALATVAAAATPAAVIPMAHLPYGWCYIAARPIFRLNGPKRAVVLFTNPLAVHFICVRHAKMF